MPSSRPKPVRAFIAALAAVLLLLCSGVKAQPCTASYSFTNNNNGTITFYNTSVPQTSSSSVFWQFPGGNPAFAISNTSVTVTYSTNGTVPVSITYSNTTCTNSLVGTASVTGVTCPVNAAFTWSITGGQVFFTNLSTGANSYTWNLGNAVSNLANPIGTYSTSGNYLITLAASNGTCTDTLNQVITVTIPPCVLTASFTPLLGPYGQVLFANHTAGTTSATTYTLFTGDGTTYPGSIPPSHTYTQNNNYVIWLTASNNSTPACFSTYSVLLAVNNITCNATFSLATFANGSVNVMASAVPSSSTSTYVWDFGDTGSSFSVTGNPFASHSYTSNGTYLIQLIFQPDIACSGYDTASVHITNIPCPISASFTFQTDTAAGTVVFINTSTGVGLDSATVSWDFGDGQISADQNPVHTYSANGTYNVTLTIQNASPFCLSATTLPVFVNNIQCAANAVITHTLQSGGKVVFADPGGSLPGISYYWDFGDGHSAEGATVNHAYSNGGTHYVSHVARISGACADTTRQAINVTGVSCNALAGFAVVTGSGGSSQLLLQYPWNVIAATWTWGDGSVSQDLVATHTYSTAGTYPVCLTVTASCGSTATACNTVNVGADLTLIVSDPALLDVKDQAVSLSRLAIFPNPCPAACKIITEGIGSPFMIEVIDATGRMIKRIESTESQETLSLDVTDLPAGLYYIRVSGPQASAITKLVRD